MFIFFLLVFYWKFYAKVISLLQFQGFFSERVITEGRLKLKKNSCNAHKITTGIIHDAHHVRFQIVMEISGVIQGAKHWKTEANCGKLARLNIEITLLEVHFRI